MFVANGITVENPILNIYLSSANGTFSSGGNAGLISGNTYYYSETKPTDTTKTYWHYVDGVPTPW